MPAAAFEPATDQTPVDHFNYWSNQKWMFMLVLHQEHFSLIIVIMFTYNVYTN